MIILTHTNKAMLPQLEKVIIMKNKSVEHLDQLVESWVNGNRSYVKGKIKSLNSEDRARIVSRFRCLVDTKSAFEIADIIIKREF